MDGFKNMASNGGACGTIMAIFSCLLGCGCLAAAVAFVVFLGIYAFNNPNAEAIYGVNVDGTEALFATMEDAEAAKATDLDDVHGNFVIWFLWGFIQQMVTCGGPLLGGLCMMISPQVASAVMGLLGCASGCGGLAWYITGLVFRCRQSGNFASGDIIPDGVTEEKWMEAMNAEGNLYQYASGNFMWTFYVIGWILMGVACGCTCIGGIITTVCASR